MTSTDFSPAGVSARGNLVIGAISIGVGAAVIPYGASMPYIREGIPGPGLFPMMVGGLLVIFGALVILTSLLSGRRDRLHGEQLAAAEAAAPLPGASAAPGSVAAEGSAERSARAPVDPSGGAELASAESVSSSSTSTASATSAAADGSAPAVPVDVDNVPADQVASGAIMDTDIGSDGIRRWINGAILMGGIVFYVLFAQTLGFPLTMAIVVTAIVWSLRARWWVAVLTGVLTTLALWSLFEQGLMVQLPDGLFRGF